MSYKLDLSDIDRDAEASLTAQIAERLQHAIDTGDLAPGEKLPTTRALAEQAGVNHLTAVRVYRRLAEQGYVTASVGRGTFVRAVPPALGPRSHRLADRRPAGAAASYPHEMFAATYRIPSDPDVLSLAAGWPDPALYPATVAGRHRRRRLPASCAATRSTTSTPRAWLRAARGARRARARRAGFAADRRGDHGHLGRAPGHRPRLRARSCAGRRGRVESPTFIGALSSLQATGARVIGVPVDEDGMDVDALERILARHEVKLVAVQPGCQNPTGRDLSAARRERLVELARERSFFILDDGVYATLRFEGDDRPRLRQSAPDHVIYVDSLSKTIGGGLRLGWIAACGPVRQRAALR